MKRKPILTLDFDGVIHSYTSGWKGAAVIPDQPVPGALRFIVAALERFDVAILSSRSHQWGGRHAMQRWMRAQLCLLGNQREIPPWWFEAIAAQNSMDPWPEEVRAAADRIVKAIRWPIFKPPSMLTIDDRALTFMGVWPELAALEEFKPWNKR